MGEDIDTMKKLSLAVCYLFFFSILAQADEYRLLGQEDLVWGDPASTVTSAGGVVSHPIDNTYKLSAQWVDVRKYGADPTGVADSTTSIQSALDLSGVIYLPKGTYKISSDLTYKSNTVIRGDGYNLTIIRNTTGRTDTKTILRPYLGSGSDNVYITGITFDQNGSSYSDSASDMSVSVDNCSDVTLSNVKFKDSITMGLWVGNNVSKLKIFNSIVDTSRGGGISLFGDISDIIVSGNYFYSCKDDALAFQDLAGATFGPRNIVVSSNIFSNNNSRNSLDSTPHGILIYGGKLVTITGNVIDNTVSDGIAVIQGQTFRSSGVNITGNVISNAGNTSDNVSGVPRNGIRIYNSDNVVISGNSVLDAKNNGVITNDVIGIAITGNRVGGSYYAGIYLWDTSHSALSSNLVYNSGVGGIDSSGLILFSTDNVTYNNNISITGNSLFDTGSGASRTQEYGLYVSGADAQYISFSNNSLYNNKIGNMTGPYDNLVNSRFQDNFGTSKRKVGNDTITTPDDNVVVTHNFGSSPTTIIITPRLAKLLYVAERDSTTFTVVNATDNATCAFDWIAEVQ
jgi:hypothetical protein